MKKFTIPILIVILLIIGGLYVATQKNNSTDSAQPPSDNQSTETSEFASSKTPLRFSYPSGQGGYTLIQPPITEQDEPGLLEALVLFRTHEYEELLQSEGGREGPPSINVLVFSFEGQTTEEWLVENSLFTNYQENNVQEIQIDGKAGVSYDWDGLYQGRTVAVAHDGEIYIFTGTFFSGVEDDRQSDFANLLATVEIGE